MFTMLYIKSSCMHSSVMINCYTLCKCSYLVLFRVRVDMILLFLLGCTAPMLLTWVLVCDELHVLPSRPTVIEPKLWSKGMWCVPELCISRYSRTSKIRTPDNQTDWSTKQQCSCKIWSRDVATHTFEAWPSHVVTDPRWRHRTSLRESESLYLLNKDRDSWEAGQRYF